MPSPIAHSAMGIAVAWLHPYVPQKDRRPTGRIRALAFAVFLANIPDLDFVLELLLGRRIHHSFTHSMVFALAFSAVVASLWVLIRHEPFGVLFSLTSLIYGSHLLLDMLGGGPGVQLLWPFTVGYLRFPLEIFPPVHYSRSWLDPSHVTFLVFELIFSAAILGGTMFLKAKHDQWTGRKRAVAGTAEDHRG